MNLRTCQVKSESEHYYVDKLILLQHKLKRVSKDSFSERFLRGLLEKTINYAWNI